MPETKVHPPHCEGHFDCPECGPESCAKVVVWDSNHAAVQVVCLKCWGSYPVLEGGG